MYIYTRRRREGEREGMAVRHGRFEIKGERTERNNSESSLSPGYVTIRNCERSHSSDSIFLAHNGAS